MLVSLYRVALISFILSLSACGGGSDSGSGPAPNNPAPPPPTPVPDNEPVTPRQVDSGLVLYGDSQATVGQSIGFGVRAENNQTLSFVRWRQTGGPESVNLLAAHTQAVGFDAPQAGTYTFEVSARVGSGSTRTTQFDLIVNDASPVQANVRLDHSATERGRVSLRVDSTADTEISSVTWEQLGGPAAQNIQYSEGARQLIYFDAPAVDNSTAIQYQATITFSDNSTASDTVLIMVRDDGINADGYFPNNNLIVTSEMKAYREDSPYASALQSCTYNNQIEQTCRFSVLPLLGQTASSPTVEQVLDKTLVSHDWMGQRFEEYLRNSVVGPDMVKLLGATTAVVISYDVRPSFFWSATGAIYLDGRNFWRTPEERDTLNDRPDFRGEFGRELGFDLFWRYAKDNQYYVPSATPYPQGQRLTRSFADLEASISWLMYHELGHANDYYPVTEWATISLNTTPLAYFRDNGATSDRLDSLYPLLSAEMKALAQVSFAGEQATATQRSYEASDIEQFFIPDRAPAYYSYSTEREDFATLFERFMMIYRLNAAADVGIFNVEDNQFTMTWGQRNRINESAIQARTRYAVENILPELDVPAIQASLPAPQLLDAAKGWSGSIVVSDHSLGSESLSVPLGPNHRPDLYLRHGPDIELKLPEQTP